MSNAEKIKALQSQLDSLKKQEQYAGSKVAPKYVGKYFTCGGSYMHITKVENATKDNSVITVRANEFMIKPSGLDIDIDTVSTISTECLQEISEAEFKRVALIGASSKIEQL